MAHHTKFSQTLEAWLKSGRVKTIGGMLDVFDEKSFAFIFLVLMILPAAPLPTGGVTHVFEIIVALIALQLIIGRDTIWLPKRLANTKLDATTQRKVLPFLMRRIQFARKYSKPRLQHIMRQKWFKSQLGLVVLLLTAGAFFAPPFTGLDTLPSLGIVFISIGIILEDIFIVGLGYLIGLAGLATTIILGAGVINGIEHLLR